MIGRINEWLRLVVPLRPTSGVRTPTVLQMEAVECGAASLGIVLGYFGRHVPLEELRAACGVSRDGSNAGNVLKVARSFGLSAKGFRRPSDAVLQGPFPSIIFWNFNHFLVVEGTRGDRVMLNDPALGRRAVSRDEFDRSYSGIVLTFERGDGFEPGGMPPKLLSRLIGLADDYRMQLAFVLFIGALIALPGFIVPGLTAVFVDNILIRELEAWLLPLIIITAGAVIIQASLAWSKATILLRLETQMALRRSADFIWHVLRLPAAFFAMRYLGDIARRVTSVENVAHLVTTELGGAVINAFTAVLIYLLMTLLDPVLAVISLAGALINVVMLRVFHQARLDVSIRLQMDQSMLFATSVIGLRTMETLKSTGGEDDFFSKWAGYHARTLNTEQRLARLDQVLAIVPPVIVMMTTAVALAVGGMRVIDGALTLGVLLAYQALFASVASPVQQLVDTVGGSQQVTADLARLDDVFRYPLDWRHQPRPASEASVQASTMGLTLDNVSFGYSSLEAPLIDKLAVKVPPGGWVALVGPSGSGKSTIGKLISGLYRPWSGEVLIDGRPLTSFTRRDLAHLIATVDQEIALFDGSLRDNICLWDETIPHEDVLAAVRDSDLLDVVSTLAGNFDAVIEEGGRNLSGGERQRMEIARALVRSPALLVLDEATSALDPPTELAIMNALRRRGMTCVVVAHRLSTIRDCDEIIVLDRGRVVERGRHAELVGQGGTYARLVAEGGPI